MISRQALKSIKPIYKLYTVYNYFLFQIKCLIAGWKDWKDRQNPEYKPVPPPKLRFRVHGGIEKESYIQTGEILANNIIELCKAINRDIKSFENILDFGCCSGRVIQNFQELTRKSRFYGTDIDLELVNWCEKHLPNIQWNVNGYQPPLPYADETFDLIYAISVFTHLDENFQNNWLKELHRISKPGTILLLTVHGENCIKDLPQHLQEEVHSKGFLFVEGVKGKLKLDKLPDFYQVAYHTKEYIEREWSRYFNVINHIERGINNHQDVIILQRI